VFDPDVGSSVVYVIGYVDRESTQEVVLYSGPSRVGHEEHFLQLRLDRSV
jgi:hypothetical protein